MSQLQNSEWMSGNPTSRPLSGWNERHGDSMCRNSSSEMNRGGEVNCRSWVLQLAHNMHGRLIIRHWAGII
jgi:hypothetical protein